MEDYMIGLLKEMRSINVKQKGSFKGWNDDEVDYYVIESDEVTLRFWNSSNQEEPRNYSDILDEIRVDILDGNEGGTVHDGWNEIMWEIV